MEKLSLALANNQVSMDAAESLCSGLLPWCDQLFKVPALTSMLSTVAWNCEIKTLLSCFLPGHSVTATESKLGQMDGEAKEMENGVGGGILDTWFGKKSFGKYLDEVNEEGMWRSGKRVRDEVLACAKGKKSTYRVQRTTRHSVGRNWRVSGMHLEREAKSVPSRHSGLGVSLKH